MVVRTNGAPAQGFWFSADVRTLTIVSTNGDFLEDLTVRTTDPREADVVNSGLEQLIEAVQTRCTVIALNVTNATTVQLIVDYANAFTAGNTETDSGTVEEEIGNAIDAISAPVNLSSTTVDTFAGFAAAAAGTAV